MRPLENLLRRLFNYYVEQHNCRVVLVAHDEKLTSGTFKKTKEKLIGQTIRVEPLVDPAFEEFLRSDLIREVRAYIEPYKDDILRIFRDSRTDSLRILRHGLLEATFDDVAQECASYTDDLLESGRLPARPLTRRYSIDRHSHDGRGYWLDEAYKDHFDRSVAHLEAAQQAALEATYPAILDNLFEVMRDRAEDFYEMVCETSTGNNPYARVPILAFAEPKKFVSAWMSAKPSEWHWIRSAIKDRYEGGLNNDLWNDKKAWLKQVHDLLTEAATGAKGIGKLRVERAFPKRIARTLQEDTIG